MKDYLKLVLVDAVLLLFSKLSALPVKLFTFIASKLGKLGFIFKALAKLFTILGKILIIPFYILTAILILMLLLKLIKNFKKKKAINAQATSVQETYNEGNRTDCNSSVNRMEVFNQNTRKQ